MVKAIVAEKAGSSDVLLIKDIKLRELKDQDVLVKHEAIGLNFIDINLRKGLYDFKFPGILGCEAAGYVEAVGKEVRDFKKGDRVAYATIQHGAYSEKRVIDQKYLVPLPDDIDFSDAAALLLKGMTAHYLLRRTFFVTDKNIVLIYAAAGGTGQLLCKLAMHYGATVIAVVGSKEKAQKVSSLGVKMIINRSEEDVATAVKKHTNNHGVHVVYDSVGQATFQKSLECLCDFGLMVNFGSASGTAQYDLSLMKEKCLFLTFPNIFVYKRNRPELLLSANEVFSLLRDKVIQPDVYRAYTFSQIKEAHEDIANQKTMGQCILLPIT